ncbi:sensor histidine kinase [Paenibacillus mucilaginosus]|uniref:Integral membrane sensor signal transduction histidine kinase n=1 Tax=Paenibacillus mucilaginosus (strain KNP414) TaxID=1036673 RepID=F8FQP5_PAEMK|nr:histidine kinase [Paenibacillus mucilaginosus]AEI40400.1 integral membrane sensor signal transduction histidine kinase [Paenibacillus mucilaginosus KNP414]MCG7213252.1 histidine kinase [Paenibacillus mucilaginosus]WDM29586.1 histidine kinase [Paenibacillus mucilaginosus]
MRLIKKIGSIPILPKIALTFLMVLTPLFYLGLKMNEAGADIVRQEIAGSLSSRVELYMDILDGDFDRSMRLLREYVNDEDLLKLSTTSEVMPVIERNRSVLRLKQQMDLLSRSSAFIENAMVFIPRMNRIVASNSNSIVDFNEEMFRTLSEPTNPLDSPFVIWDNRVFITMPYGYIDNGPLFLIAVEISSAEISAKLKQFALEDSIAVLSSDRMVWSSLGESAPALDNETRNVLYMAEEGSRRVSIDNRDYLLAIKKSEIHNTKLLMMVPSEKVERPLDRYRNWVFVLYGVSVLVIIAFSFSMYRIIHRPLMQLVRSFRKIEQGRFDVSVDYPFQDEFGYLYRQLNAMILELKRLIQEVYEQQYRIRLAELKHLQSQINPHFLYNTFFILYRMAKQDGNERIMGLTKHLGEYFQFITRDDVEEVTLASEAAHSKSYTEIQSIRFSNRITVRFAEVPKGAEQLLVPRLILQPIIENAFIHSLEKRAKGGVLEVDFHMRESELHIRVEDSGGIDEAIIARLQALLNGRQDVTVTTGMINVHRRLQIKFGGTAGLHLSKGELGGLQIMIVIPLQGG